MITDKKLKSMFSMYGVKFEDGMAVMIKVGKMDQETLGSHWRELDFNINIVKNVPLFHADRLEFDLIEKAILNEVDGSEQMAKLQQWHDEEAADAGDLL